MSDVAKALAAATIAELSAAFASRLLLPSSAAALRAAPAPLPMKLNLHLRAADRRWLAGQARSALDGIVAAGPCAAPPEGDHAPRIPLAITIDELESRLGLLLDATMTGAPLLVIVDGAQPWVYVRHASDLALVEAALA